jgi:hypothetical protein
MNRRELIKSVFGGLITLPVMSLAAKTEDISDINYIIKLFIDHGYYVTPTKMYAPVALYNFEKMDILTFPTMQGPIPFKDGPYVVVEASIVRYRTREELINWIKLGKEIYPNNIFIPYKSGITQFAMPSDEDCEAIHFENFNFVRGVWFDPEKTLQYKKYYNIS